MTLKLININYFKQELFNNNDLTIINCMLWIILKQEIVFNLIYFKRTWYMHVFITIFDGNNFLFYKASFYKNQKTKKKNLIKMKITVEKSSTKKAFSE